MSVASAVIAYNDGAQGLLPVFGNLELAIAVNLVAIPAGTQTLLQRCYNVGYYVVTTYLTTSESESFFDVVTATLLQRRILRCGNVPDDVGK